MNAKDGNPQSGKPADPERTALDWPREAGLSEEFLAKVDLRLRWRRRRRIAGTASLAILVFFVAFWGVPYVRDTATVATVAAQRHTHALTDGSSAELNAGSSLHVDFRHGQRMVQLTQGEAFFSVAKDTARPFFVKTSAGTIRVTGTQFNVRVSGTGAVEVTLMEGSVTIQHASRDSENLVPGQQLVLGPAGANLRALPPDALENVVAWRRGRIALDGLTLAQAAERMGAFHGQKIAVAPDIAGLHPGGVIPLNDLKGFFSGLETALAVQVLPVSDGSFRIVGSVRR